MFYQGLHGLCQSLWSVRFLWHVSTERFVWLDVIRCSTVCISATKSGLGPDLAAINHTYLSVLLHWGTKRSERVPKSWSYTHRPLIGRKVFLDDGENLGLMKKMLLKSLASFLDDLRCCSLFNVTHSSFSLAGYTVSGCYVVTMLT